MQEGEYLLFDDSKREHYNLRVYHSQKYVTPFEALKFIFSLYALCTYSYEYLSLIRNGCVFTCEPNLNHLGMKVQSGKQVFTWCQDDFDSKRQKYQQSWENIIPCVVPQNII